MKFAILLLVVVFAAGFTVGVAGTPVADAAGGGGGGSCTYTCTCNGTPLKCCTTPFGQFCSPTDEFACPQVMGC